MTDHYGVDLSHWQTVDWEDLHREFTEFAIVKCSQGFTRDPKHEDHCTRLLERSVPHGNYLLYDNRYSAQGQLDKFLTWRIGGQFRDAFDAEWQIAYQNVLTVLKGGFEETGRRWLFYTNYNLFLNYFHRIKDEILHYADLWLAWPKYRGSLVPIPDPIPSIRGWPQPLVWQFDWHSRPGWIRTEVDRNKVRGEDWSLLVDEEPTLTLQEKVDTMWALRHSHEGG